MEYTISHISGTLTTQPFHSKHGKQGRHGTFQTNGKDNGETTSHVRLRDEDELIWGFSKKGHYSPNEGYDIIHADHKPDRLKSWWSNIWKLKALPRTKLVMWTIIMGKTPSGANLRKRAFPGPTWCVLCHAEEELNHHLFLSCTTTQHTWAQVIHTLRIPQSWNSDDIPNAWERWWESSSE